MLSSCSFVVLLRLALKPQALKGYGESLPATVANQDAFTLGETVPQLGKVFVMATLGEKTRFWTFFDRK